MADKLMDRQNRTTPITSFDVKLSLKYSLSGSKIEYMKFANLCYNIKEKPSKLLNQFYLELLGVQNEQELFKLPELRNYFEEGKKLLTKMIEKRTGEVRFELSKYMKFKMEEFRKTHESQTIN